MREAASQKRRVRCRGLCVKDANVMGRKGNEGSFKCFTCSRVYAALPDIYVKAVRYRCPCCNGAVRGQRMWHNSSKLLARIKARCILLDGKPISPIVIGKLLPLLMVLQETDLSSKDVLQNCGSSRYSLLKEAVQYSLVSRELKANRVGRPTVMNCLTIQGRNFIEKLVNY